MVSDKLEPENLNSGSKENEPPSKGPSLVLLYTLIALAMLLATFFAALIVLPFYLHR
jgi:hypothetical protein